MYIMTIINGKQTNKEVDTRRVQAGIYRVFKGCADSYNRRRLAIERRTDPRPCIQGFEQKRKEPRAAVSGREDLAYIPGQNIKILRR